MLGTKFLLSVCPEVSNRWFLKIHWADFGGKESGSKSNGCKESELAEKRIHFGWVKHRSQLLKVFFF